MKRCSKCGLEKTTIDFCQRKRNKDGLDTWCKKCKQIADRNYRIKPENKKRKKRQDQEYKHRPGIKERIEEYNKKSRFAKYGLTLEVFERMFLDQGKCCKICKTSVPESKKYGWVIDHDHKTGKVRGILCQPCNMMLGGSRDDQRILQEGINYLIYANT